MHLAAEDTYIALTNQATVTITNNSDVPVDFSWRGFASVQDEINQKLKLQVQLRQEEQEEELFLQHVLEDETEEGGDSSDGEGGGGQAVDKKVITTLQRKYEKKHCIF